jgi:hypothetical protein
MLVAAVDRAARTTLPREKWMILTTADTYGADVQTRIELQDLPEATYHDIGGVVAAVESAVGVGPPPRSFRRPGAAIGVRNKSRRLLARTDFRHRCGVGDGLRESTDGQFCRQPAFELAR